MTRRMLVRSAVIIAMVAFAVANSMGGEQEPPIDERSGNPVLTQPQGGTYGTLQKRVYGTGESGSLNLTIGSGAPVTVGRVGEFRQDFYNPDYDGSAKVEIRVVQLDGEVWETATEVFYKVQGLWPSAPQYWVRLKEGANLGVVNDLDYSFEHCDYDGTDDGVDDCIGDGIPILLFGELKSSTPPNGNSQGYLHALVEGTWKKIAIFCLQPRDAKSNQKCPEAGSIAVPPGS